MLNLNSFTPNLVDCSGNTNLSPCTWSPCKSFNSDWTEITGVVPRCSGYYGNYAPCSWKVSIANTYISGYNTCDNSSAGMCDYINGDYYVDYTTSTGSTRKTEGNRYVQLAFTPDVPNSAVSIELYISQTLTISDAQIDSTQHYISLTKTFPITNWDCRNLSFNFSGATIARDWYCAVDGSDVNLVGQYDYNSHMLYEQESITGNQRSSSDTKIFNSMDFFALYSGVAYSALSQVSCGADSYCRNGSFWQLHYCSGHLGICAGGCGTANCSLYYPVSNYYDTPIVKSIFITGIYDYHTNLQANNSGQLLTPTVCFRCSGLNGYMQYNTSSPAATSRINKSIDCLCRADNRYVEVHLAHPSSVLIIQPQNQSYNQLYFVADTPLGISPPSTLRFSVSGYPSNNETFQCRSSGAYIDVDLEWKDRHALSTLYAKPTLSQTLYNDTITGFNLLCPSRVQATVTITDWSYNGVSCTGSCPQAITKPPIGSYIFTARKPGPFTCGFDDYILSTGVYPCIPNRISLGSTATNIFNGFRIIYTNLGTKTTFSYTTPTGVYCMPFRIKNSQFAENIFFHTLIGNTFTCTFSEDGTSCWTPSGIVTISYDAI